MEQSFGQAAWRIETDEVTAFVTELGGHLAPVTFHLPGRDIQPFSIAPWYAEEIRPDQPPIIRVLRGDFFCMPFGANVSPFGTEQYQLHGETANALWTGSVDGSRLIARIEFTQRPGSVLKQIELRAGEHAVYSNHVVSGMFGPMTFGYHAMLRFDSPGLVSTSPFRIGEVFPERLEDPAIGGYSSLKPGARFSALDHVPMANGEVADLSRYPAREGFEDLVMLVSASSGLAWTTVTFPDERFVWFCLRNASVLQSTMLWHSNGGRHYAPWSGRHRRVLGLEDLTSYYHYGLAESVADNPMRREGVRTFAELSPDSPLEARTVMGVAACESGFGHVARIEPGSRGITLVDAAGKTVRASVDPSFVL